MAQLAKPLGIPIGLTIMPGNMHDGRHMLETYSQVRSDLTDGSTMIFDAGANNKTVLNTIMDDGKHYLTRKRFNKSDDVILTRFSEDVWECIDEVKGEYCLKKVFPSRVNYYFFSRALRPGEEVCSEEGEEEAERGQRPSERSLTGEETEEEIQDRQRPDQSDDIPPDQTDGDLRGRGSVDVDRERHYRKGGILLSGIGPGHGPARSAVQVQVEGRGGETVLIDEV